MERENTQRAILIRVRRVGVYLREMLLQVMTVQNFLDEVRIRVAHNLKLAPESTKTLRLNKFLIPWTTKSEQNNEGRKELLLTGARITRALPQV